MLTAQIGCSGLSGRAGVGSRTISARRWGVNGKGLREEGLSAAGDAHVAADARAVVPAVDDEVMALRLQSNGAIDRGTEQGIVRRSPQRFAQIGGIFLAEAGVERAGAGDPHPIAGLAEIVGHRRDEAELAAGLSYPDIAGRAAGVVVEIGQR